MARRLEDVTMHTDGTEDAGPYLTPERLAKMMADMEALDRGELPVVTLDELSPLLESWDAETPDGQSRDYAAELAALPWRTGRERGWVR